jgi:hypothetical protein
MKPKRILSKLVVLGLIAATLVPLEANAAVGELTSRSATLSTSQAGATANVVLTFTSSAAAGSYLAKGIQFQLCDSPLAGTCNQPTGANFSTASSTLGGQTGISGFAESNKTATEYDITNSSGSTLNSTAVTVTINGLTLPSTANQEFYFRVTTYTDTGLSAPSGGEDFGGIAVSTAQQITVSGTMPESLVFCVGTSGSNCTNMSGSAVNLGTFSPAGTNTGTSLMDVSTNAGSGYAITVNGTVPTSGSNTIAAMGTQSANSAGCAVSCTSTTGTGQFGTNVRANTTPSVGADVTPTGAGYNGAGAGGYNTANSFRFFTGDTVASSTQVSNSQLFTNSYLVNVAGSQAAGLYTSTMTYICTATF